MLHPAIFEEISRTHGPFDVDLCASVDGSNAQVRRYFSKDNSALDHDIKNMRTWANVPYDNPEPFMITF